MRQSPCSPSSFILLTISTLALFSFTAAATQTNKTKQPSIMAEQLYSDVSLVMPELANMGELQVGVQTIEIDGPNLLQVPKGRRLTLEVWYPTEQRKGDLATYSDVTRSKRPFTVQGKALRNAPAISYSGSFPLIILSHGYTGYRSMMFYLGEHLASHGYVVASLDHTDSTNKDIDFEKNSGAGFHSTLLHRSRDQQAALEYIDAHAREFGANAKNASVIGYSMGGYGALNTVGACHRFSDSTAKAFGFESERQADLVEKLNNCNAGKSSTDSRWKSMVAIAPWGGANNVFTGMENISVPSLFIAGDQDDVSGYDKGVKMLYEQTGANNKYLLVYQNARHNIAPHPAPSVAYKDALSLGHYHEPAWNTQSLNHINQHMILAFLNCHVKGNGASCQMLPSTADITQKKLTNGSLTKPWPGFKDRFGAGVLFFRGSK